MTHCPTALLCRCNRLLQTRVLVRVLLADWCVLVPNLANFVSIGFDLKPDGFARTIADPRSSKMERFASQQIDDLVEDIHLQAPSLSIRTNSMSVLGNGEDLREQANWLGASARRAIYPLERSILSAGSWVHTSSGTDGRASSASGCRHACRGSGFAQPRRRRIRVDATRRVRAPGIRERRSPRTSVIG
jgi:hypothetical protein